MAKKILTDEQRETLLMWLAADYDTGLIRKWFVDRNWPLLTHQNIYAYRKQYGLDIDKLRKERRESALNTGLALKEERVQRLTQHADALEAIKWEPGENGRLYNEKAWRETLDDIAAETGGRSKSVALTGADGGDLIPKPETMKPSEIAALAAQISADILKAVKQNDDPSA